ncbi:MAG: DNA mismatch repair protein MutS, partial [Candidatus Hodarchaeota archaeon]
SKKTPMMAQWEKFRHQYSKEYILAFRMGDFFEFFNDDAEAVAKILDITCTTRQGMPLAGFPYASGHENLEKIVKSGRSVVVVDQVEDPKKAQGKIVKRDIVRIITPGTILDENMLERDSNNYVASLFMEESKKSPGRVKFSIAFCDLSTGEFFTTAMVDSKDIPSILTMEMSKFSPVELLVPDSLNEESLFKKIKDLLPGIEIRKRSDLDFDPDDGRNVLLKHFNVTNLEGFGIEDKRNATGAAGALVAYLQENQKTVLSNITSSSHRTPTRYMQIDHNTVRNLEILRNYIDGSTRGTLFDVFSKTGTPMARRLMKRILLSPLMDKNVINQRLDFVDYLIKNLLTMEDLKEQLNGICDMERLISRINYSSVINARHLIQLIKSLERIPAINQLMEGIDLDFSSENTKNLKNFDELTATILDTFVEEPPAKISEGGMIKNGLHAELDELRAIRSGSKDWLDNFQKEMREKHGITTIKVKYNKVFGYFIEVSKSHIDKVPDSWTRKQTLVNAERYINPELKEMEEKILNAEERIFEIERDIFMEMKEKVITYTKDIQLTAKAIAEIDVLLTFASVAGSNNYTRPDIQDDGSIIILDGRHPTIEKIIGTDKFIPNDIDIDPKKNVLNIVTGPNMSGKSTYLRQICLIVLLAQVGSFVPARKAQIGIVDKIFSRVGAMDDITRNRSTFMVELNQCAYILNHATSKSLVILDELGRGTSTFDGVSIAWAVAEYLHAKGVKTLFATHYHQLSDLESFLPSSKNLNVLIKEDEKTKDLIFLHKVEEGSCDKSYGIQVAKLAGLPIEVVSRANEILSKLTDDDPLTTDQIKMISKNGITMKEGKRSDTKKTKQMMLFPIISKSDKKLNELKEEIQKLEIENITPIDALNILKNLRDKLK